MKYNFTDSKTFLIIVIYDLILYEMELAPFYRVCMMRQG